MAITYSWKVTGMNTKSEGDVQDAVIQVYWTKSGVNEDGVEGFCPGESKFIVSDIAIEEFVPFDQLTEEIVLGWVQAHINPAYHEGIDEQIQKMIERKISPVINKGLPWDPSSVPPTIQFSPDPVMDEEEPQL